MPLIFKRCDLCDGEGKIYLIDDITSEEILENCPICKGQRGFNIHITWSGELPYNWRYDKDNKDKGEGYNNPNL